MRTSVSRSFAWLPVALVFAAFAAWGQEESPRGGGEAPPAIEEIVVTAVPRATETLRSSVSVTTLDSGAIEEFSPRTTAEIFRSVPGIRSESSGGDGNANIAVRGIPISTGGAKFLQIQEDGLPVMEFGDISFGNADIFVRADTTLQGLQVVRGGSASTFASNSPGGVINFLSRTGEVFGGQVGFTAGLDFDHERVDFSLGGPLAEGWRAAGGGFFRRGDGVREAGYRGESGGQLKFNITREFENGYLRLYFKSLNDRAIGYLPSPVQVTGTNSNPTYQSIPGYDAATQTLHTPHLRHNPGIGGDGQRRTSDVADGMHANVRVFGFEASFDLEGGWSLLNRFRYADTSGRFVSPFTAEVGSAQAIADVVAERTGAQPDGMTPAGGATLVYANGGGAIADPGALNGNGLLARIHLFDVEINDFGNFANDAQLTRSFDFAGGGSLDVQIGYYRSRQSIDMDWLWNSYLLEVKGDGARLVDVMNASGELVTQNGLIAYGVPFWGNCCQRGYDAEYDIQAPYFSVSLESGALTLDASLRFDIGSASGSYAPTTTARVDVNRDGEIQRSEEMAASVNNAAAKPLDYDWDYVSWSLGANYTLGERQSVFARISRGGRANADRLLFGDSILDDGSIRDEDAAVDMVDQYEVGWRWRGGALDLSATLFFAETGETNFEATSRTFTDAEYESLGLELEGAWRIRNFSLTGGVTWTDAELVKDAINPANVGNVPRRQADFVYQFTGSWRLGGFSAGANLVGTTESYAQFNNQLEMPGYIIVNPYFAYEFAGGLRVSLNMNNIFDEFAVTEVEEGAIVDGMTNYVRARPLNGRSVTLSLAYDF